MCVLQVGVVVSELSSSWSDVKRLAPDPFLVSVVLTSYDADLSWRFWWHKELMSYNLFNFQSAEQNQQVERYCYLPSH